MATHPLHRRLCRVALPLATALALGGCGTAHRQDVPGAAPEYGTGSDAASAFAWSSRMAALESQVEGSLGGSGAKVTRTKDERLWITLPGDLSFEPGRSALKPPVRSLLDRVVVALRSVPKAEIRIVGHTDAKGTAAANNALSLDRAASTRDWLVARGVSPVRFVVAGRGAQDPVASNEDEAGRARNRRVEILIGERPAAPGRGGSD